MVNWLERAKASGNPVIDDAGGSEVTVTFVLPYEGTTTPILGGDFTGWLAGKPIRMERAGKGVWAASVALPRDAYVEYAYFLPPENGDELTDEHRLLDPLNSRRVWNGIAAYNNAVSLPDFRMIDLVRRKPGVPRGTVTRHVAHAGMAAVGGKRLTYLYRPPVDEPVPLVVVWDGPDYLRRGHLTAIVDNLIAQRRIRPIALVMPQNGKQARMLEYSLNELTLYFARECLWSLAQEHLNILDAHAQIDGRGAHGVLGASMGGLMALFTGLRLPHVFGHVIAQSGAFQFELDGVSVGVYDYVRCADERMRRIKIWQDVGTLEWLLEGNRKMHRALRENGFDVTYHEFHAGHNYTAWANNVWRGLELMYGA